MGVVNNNAYGGANLNNRRADDEMPGQQLRATMLSQKKEQAQQLKTLTANLRLLMVLLTDTNLKMEQQLLTRVFQLSTMADRISTGNEVKSFVKPNIGADNSYNSGIKEDLGEERFYQIFDDCNNGALTGVYSNCDFGNRGWNVTDGKLWATSYTNEEQANKIAIPDKYALTSFEAYCAKGTATVKVEAGEESETFTVTGKKQTFTTNFKKKGSCNIHRELSQIMVQIRLS